jgi:hypothetical protein
VADSAHEQENPRVRGEVSIANPFGSIVSSHDPRHPAAPISHRSPSKTTNDRRDYPFGHSLPLQSPTNFFVTHGISSPSSTFRRKSYSLREFTFRLFFLYSQGYPKVCPISLNLLNADDSFTRISSLTSYYLFSRTRDLIALI